MSNPVIIFGAKGLAKVALSIFKSNDVIIYGFLEDDPSLHQQSIEDISILGSTEDETFLKVIGKKCDAFIATDDNALRKSLVEMLLTTCKVMPMNAIHQKTVLATSVSLGHGNLIAAGVIIESYSEVGNHCILNAGCVIDYEVKIGDFVQIGSGSVINANVIIEDGAFIGSGVTIVSGVKIGKNARIGAGSVVIENVANAKTVFGVPAKVM